MPSNRKPTKLPTKSSAKPPEVVKTARMSSPREAGTPPSIQSYRACASLIQIRKNHPALRTARFSESIQWLTPHGGAMSETDWQRLVKGMLKAELKRRNVSYKQLAEKLAELGIEDTERNINNKISRGGFTAANRLGDT